MPSISSQSESFERLDSYLDLSYHLSLNFNLNYDIFVLIYWHLSEIIDLKNYNYGHDLRIKILFHVQLATNSLILKRIHEIVIKTTFIL